MKSWRQLSVGPVSLFYRFGRSVPVSNNRRRQHQRVKLDRGTPVPPASAVSPQRDYDSERDASTETALIVGVGPGYGFELARRFAASGMRVALASRNAERLDDLVDELSDEGGQVNAYGCDATDERSVAALLATVTAELGAPHLVVYAVQGFCRGTVLDTEVPAFEESWRQNCLGGFIVARAAARMMVPL
ncbi:SDR family NAD(P)-dependent oxidoreductase, partial [Massilia sp. DJPM01]|uniref:SDR family NAD(P)-dependent oxidoreductase n=1 Tax=Massilia sp. DJPM01 TaxID=3024404 RepID=UPI00259ECC7D